MSAELNHRISNVEDNSHDVKTIREPTRDVPIFEEADVVVAGGDMWNQAMSGIVSLLGYPGGRPSMPPFPACDHLLTDDPKFNTDETLYKIREEIGRLLDEAFSKKPGRNGSRYSAKLGCVAIHADL
jgi:hypothetical protein